jgi:hypothetical protein
MHGLTDFKYNTVYPKWCGAQYRLLNGSLEHTTLLVHNPVTLAFFFQIRDTKLRSATSDKTLGAFRQTIGSILLICYWTRSIFFLDQNILCHNYEEPNIAGSNFATYFCYFTNGLCVCPQSIQVNTWVLRESRPRTGCFYMLKLVTHLSPIFTSYKLWYNRNGQCFWSW